MGHITVFSFMLSLAVAATNLAVNIILYQKNKQRFHKFVILLAAAFLVGLILDLFYNYYGTHIRSEVSINMNAAVLLVDRLTGTIIVGLEYFFFCAFSLLLYNYQLTKWFIGTYWGVWSIFLLLFFTGNSLGIEIGNESIPTIINYSLNWTGRILSVLIVAFLIKNSSRIIKIELRRASNNLILLFAIIFMAIIVSDIFKFANYLTERAYYFIGSVFYILLGIFSLVGILRILRIKGSFIELKKAPTFTSPIDEQFDSICVNFGITKREKEIIQLICIGKSNKEISQLLHITNQSVKDHNYRIYQKMNIKNRVQLVNIFK